MPRNHGRKTDLRAIERATGAKRHDAIRLRNIEDPRQRAIAVSLIATGQAVTVPEAMVASVILCDECGWTAAQECRECNGCACTTGTCHDR